MLRPYLIKVHRFTGDEIPLFVRTIIADPVGDAPERLCGLLIPVQHEGGVLSSTYTIRLPRFVCVVIVGEDTLGVGDEAVKGVV
jgi:hypothetical protein